MKSRATGFFMVTGFLTVLSIMVIATPWWLFWTGFGFLIFGLLLSKFDKHPIKVVHWDQPWFHFKAPAIYVENVEAYIMAKNKKKSE